MCYRKKNNLAEKDRATAQDRERGRIEEMTHISQKPVDFTAHNPQSNSRWSVVESSEIAIRIRSQAFSALELQCGY